MENPIKSSNFDNLLSCEQLEDGTISAANATPVRHGDVLDNPIIPIMPEDGKDHFPIDKMPQWFRDLVMETADYTDAPVGLVGMCSISTMSLGLQHLINVDYYNRPGKHAPVSTMCITLNESGGGKSQVFRQLLGKTKERINNTTEETSNQQNAFDYAAESARVAAHKIEDRVERKAAILAIEESKCDRPIDSNCLFERGTIQGALDCLEKKNPSMMMSSDEAAGWFSGYSLQADTVMATIATLTQLYDSGCVSETNRGKTTRIINRRLSLMLSGQPSRTIPTLRRPELSEQGFLARALVCNPPSNIGYRSSRVRNECTPHSDQFATKTDLFLSEVTHTPRESGVSKDPFQIHNQVLGFDKDAIEFLQLCQDTIEERVRPGGEY